MRRALILAALTAGTGFVLAGCGGGVDPGVSAGDDLANGKGLFIQNCGGCHAMADAGTQGLPASAIDPGPTNLDWAFQFVREGNGGDGFESSTLEQVVREQMEIPGRWPDLPPTEEGGSPTPSPRNMPSREELGISREDADDIAFYVATCAGLPAEQAAEVCPPAPPPPPAPSPAPPADGDGDGEAARGAEVFASAQPGCGTCHTFAPAGSTGAVGPNLDETQLDRPAIVARITEGRGAMPPYGGSIAPEDIEALADFILGG